MRTNASGGRRRALLEVIDEAIGILRQDAGEYGFIALVGAVPAALAVVIASIIDDPIGLGLMALIIAMAAIVTVTAAASAIRRGAENLQPDAGSAYVDVLAHGFGLLCAWTPLLAGLFTASFVVASFREYFGPVPATTAVPILIGAGVLYGFPRSFYAPALLTGGVSPRQADAASAALVRRMRPVVGIAWAFTLLPALVIAPFGLVAGFDAALGAIVVFIFVGALPVTAALMELLFFEAQALIQFDVKEPQPRRGPQPHHGSARIR